MKAFTRIFAFCVVCGTLGVSLSASAIPYHKVVDKFPMLESGMGRIFFFGRNSSFVFKPTLSINGEKLDGPYGKNIFFFIDRPAGEYVLAVDGEVALQFDLGRGEKKYVAMEIGKPINPESGLFEPASLGWIMTLRLLPAHHAEAVMRNMRWKKTKYRASTNRHLAVRSAPHRTSSHDVKGLVL